MPADGSGTDRRRRYWDKHSASYDKQMGFFDRHLFAAAPGYAPGHRPYP